MTPELTKLILNLLIAFAPVISDTIRKYQETHNGALPTDAEMAAILHANIDSIVAEGELWKRSHGL